MSSRSWIVVAALTVGACAAPATTPVHDKVTIEEAKQIRDAAERYLRARPELAELPLPGDPVVDAWGTLRLGEWILESGRDELLLTYRVAQTQMNIVRQELVVERAGAGWKVVRNGEVIHHLHRP